MSIASYLIPILIIAYLAWQWRPILHARRQRGSITPGLEPLFQGIVPEKIAVYFWSRHCIMCHGMTPIIQRIAKDRADIISLDAEQNIALAKGMGVMATPTLVIVQKGRITKIVVGAQSESRIRHLLDEYGLSIPASAGSEENAGT